MDAGVRKTVLILALVVLAVIGLTFNKFNGKPTLDTEALREQGVVWYETPRTFVFNPLKKASGETFQASDLEGPWTLMYFGFTYCPDICPATLANLAQVMKELKAINPEVAQKVNVVLVSVDPQRDTPDKLAQYVDFFDKDFVGVTGDSANLKALTQQLNVAFEIVGDIESDDYLVEHSAQVVLVNPKGDYQGFLRPPFKPQELADALVKVDQAF
ncbi:SCO family protein [Parendozoicomonas sp. Alg238-R29]|uniref:SCO family protein n=1 Tax=Parendozoicomonas sp. Alg238-R29 TaxID=2993446 RepID=UPI00248E0AF9|nr:SCO family protein [Parendozoicomonas sp. Alg238-R29]